MSTQLIVSVPGSCVALGLRAHEWLAAPVGASAQWRIAVFAIVWIAGSVLMLFPLFTHPALLRRRLRAGPIFEPEVSQKIIVTLVVLCLLALFGVSVGDLLSGWSQVAIPVVILGDVLVAAGLLLILLTFRANPFAASTVTVEAEQTVISTGPYALVRHPLYSGGLLMFLGAPLALGSWWGLVLYPPILALVIVRLLDEESYLSAHLPGYRAYCAKVTHRLVPAIW
jgi:protein-S-isoprenylcysteine O-methyltransferase Ste14